MDVPLTDRRMEFNRTMEFSSSVLPKTKGSPEGDLFLFGAPSGTKLGTGKKL